MPPTSMYRRAATAHRYIQASVAGTAFAAAAGLEGDLATAPLEARAANHA